MINHQAFLQSREWEEFQQAVGHYTDRVAGQLLIKHITPVGEYWYSPRPKIDTRNLEALEEFAKSKESVFIRIDPSNDLDFGSERHRWPLFFTRATQVQHTLVLKLQDSEKLFQTFHSKTRYNIRLAEKKGVTIKEFFNDDSKGIEAFIELSSNTANRQQIRYHDRNYYRKMMELLGERKSSREVKVSVWVAYVKKEPIAANIVLWQAPFVYYLHGASKYEARSLMAPHLLQWETIKAAIEQGCEYYDFFGIASPKGEIRNPKSEILNYQYSSSHPLAGVTRFKLGFGGEVVSFPDSFDLVMNQSRYWLYQVLRGVNRIINRLK